MDALLFLGALALLHVLTRLWIRASCVELRLGVLAAMRAADDAMVALTRDEVSPWPSERLASLLTADRPPLIVGQQRFGNGDLGWRIEDARRWN